MQTACDVKHRYQFDVPEPRKEIGCPKRSDRHKIPHCCWQKAKALGLNAQVKRNPQEKRHHTNAPTTEAVPYEQVKLSQAVYHMNK